MMQTTTIQQFDLLIGGRLRAAEQGRVFESLDPSTGEVWAKVANASPADMQEAILAARQAFDQQVWSSLSYPQRGKYLRRIAELIREHAKELAEIESRDTGKTTKQTTFIDVPTAAESFEYFAKIDHELRVRKNDVAAPVKSLTVREPIGVVGIIIPWNYPLIMFGWKVAPALIAGNTVVLKPSSLASISLLRLGQILEQAGLPQGVLNIVATSDREAASELVRNSNVDMINFTGGTETGQEIMRLASGTTKKLSLELGGKSPNIVFADCDFEAAVGGTLSAIFMNQGQMCTAGSRLLLQEEIYERFLAALIAKTKKIKVGPSSQYDTDFGPVISGGHRDRLIQFIQKAVKEGAKVAVGGKVPEDMDSCHGFYLEPTILVDVTSKMAAAQEEIFGPVLSVIKFKTEEDAVRIANDSRYGLAACIWSKDLDKANAVSSQLKCGTVWVNTYGGFYNEASFGGYKQSGFGRSLGNEGLLEYTQSKHICIDQTPGGTPLAASWF